MVVVVGWLVVFVRSWFGGGGFCSWWFGWLGLMWGLEVGCFVCGGGIFDCWGLLLLIVLGVFAFKCCSWFGCFGLVCCLFCLVVLVYVFGLVLFVFGLVLLFGLLFVVGLISVVWCYWFVGGLVLLVYFALICLVVCFKCFSRWVLVCCGVDGVCCGFLLWLCCGLISVVLLLGLFVVWFVYCLVVWLF